MKLYLQAFALSIKYTLKAAALPFVALLLCVLLVQGQSLSRGAAAPAPVLEVGVLCLDTHPLIPLLMQLISDSPQTEEFAQLHMLSPGEPVPDGLAAVITLPRGFTDSILTGENLSPTVQLHTTGLSTVYLQELCTALERYLASAQAGILATLDTDTDISPEQYSALALDVNLRYVNLFVDRLSMLSQRFYNYDSNYLLGCVVTVLLLLLCGALGGGVPALLALARAMGGIRGSSFALFAGGSCGVLLVCLPVTVGTLTLTFGERVLEQPLALLLSAILLSAVGIFFFILVGNGGTAALLLCGFTLATALLAGLIIPLELLPETLTRLSPLLPIHGLHQLVTVAGGGAVGDVFVGAAAHAILWFGASGLVWRKGVGRT